MHATEFNGHVAAAARNQRLPGFIRRGSGGGWRHKWKVAVEKIDPGDGDFGVNPLTGQPYFSASVFAPKKQSRLARVTVGTGSVNDECATIEYLASGDPRGWIMPKNYAPRLALTKVFGDAYPFVDRPLWDTPQPCLLLTLPDDAAHDLGGFVKTPDQRRPEFFKTQEMWALDLYQASVVVNISPYHADPTSLAIREGGQRSRRWRLSAGRLPTPSLSDGLGGMANKELARIYLTRDPAHPENDELYVQQLTFWNLRAHPAIAAPLLALLAAVEGAAVLDLGLLALGLTGITVATAVLAIEAAIVNLLLDDLEGILAGTASMEFWSV